MENISVEQNKMIEIIDTFGFLNESTHIQSFHLAEGPGSFIQATILFRDLLEKLKKITIH